MKRPNLSERAVRLAVALGVGAVVAALGLWAQNGSLVGVSYDDGIYALLSKALSDGDGYRLTYLPGGLPGVKYPPIYPLSLVPFWSLAGSQDAALHAMKLANGLYIGIAAGLFAFVLADLAILSAPLAGAVALLGFASGSMMLVSTGLLSEPLYLVLLFLTLWASDRVRRRPTGLRAMAVGLLAGLVVLTRMVGVAALAAALIALARRGGRRSALTAAAVAAVLIGPWLAFALSGAAQVPDVLVPRYGSYAQLYFSNVAGSPLAALEIAATNIGAILQTLGSKLVPQLSALPQSLAGAALVGLALLGSRRIFRDAPATASYPWLYLLLISVWSFPPFRFVFILFPLLLALAAVSFPVLIERAVAFADRRAGVPASARGTWLRRAIVAVGLIVAANVAYREAQALRHRVWDGAQLEKSAVGREVIDWVKRYTGPESVIAYAFDPMLALHTGRSAVPSTYEPVHAWYRSAAPPVEALARLLREMGVDYVAVRRDVPAAAAPLDALLGRYPNSLRLVYVTGRGALVFRTDLTQLPARRDGPGVGAEPQVSRGAGQ